MGKRDMSFLYPQSSGRRWAGLSVALGLHGVLVYALFHGTVRQTEEVLVAALQTQIIEEPKSALAPPATPPRQPVATPPSPSPSPSWLSTPQKPPDTRSDLPLDAHLDVPTPLHTITTVSQTPAPVPVTLAAPKQPVRTAAVVDARNCKKPLYPRESLRANESGRVVLQFLIGANGVVTESKIERSSGFGRLDKAASDALSLCQFTPDTEDGKPVQSWAKIEYLWKVED